MLSPWDAYRWFETPAERTVSLPLGSGWVQLCERNTRRVVLILGCPPTASGQVSLNRGGANTGLRLLDTLSPLVFTQQQHGPLCQEPWFGMSGGGSFITVIEVFLRDWPHSEEGPPDGA